MQLISGQTSRAGVQILKEERQAACSNSERQNVRRFFCYGRHEINKMLGKTRIPQQNSGNVMFQKLKACKNLLLEYSQAANMPLL